MIQYDSPAFWAAIKGDFVTVDADGSAYTWFRIEPSIPADANYWSNCEDSCCELDALDLDRASLPPWRESLRNRPT